MHARFQTNAEQPERVDDGVVSLCVVVFRRRHTTSAAGAAVGRRSRRDLPRRPRDTQRDEFAFQLFLFSKKKTKLTTHIFTYLAKQQPLTILST